MQDLNLNQLKLKVNNTYQKNEKITTKFEAVNDEDVINKAYLDTNLSKIAGQISLIEKDYNEFNLLSIKQSVEEVLIQRAVKTSIQTLYDQGLFENYDNANEVLKKIFNC